MEKRAGTGEVLQRLKASDELSQKLTFLVELDGLKSVVRQTALLNQQRQENSAEHSWHLALYVFTLKDYALKPLDLTRALLMALIHDIVEIDAGDAFVYNSKERQEKQVKEAQAAARIFGLLEPGGSEFFHELWQEFEAKASVESRFVSACDRFQPLVHNFLTLGYSWQKHQVHKSQVLKLISGWQEDAPALADLAIQMVEHATDRGWLLS